MVTILGLGRGKVELHTSTLPHNYRVTLVLYVAPPLENTNTSFYPTSTFKNAHSDAYRNSKMTKEFLIFQTKN